jgi:hypothetical protein
MSTDRLDVLDRLAAGEISPAEAAQILRTPSPLARPQARHLAQRWLHVRVTDLDTGRRRVNVDLPLSWVEVGLSLGARYYPDMAGIDLAQIVEQIRDGAGGKLVEVEDLDERVRVELFVD